MRWLPTAPLPLLAKELAEQAARRRTYVVRGLYAVLLFAVFSIYAYGEYGRAEYVLSLLGSGGKMFEALVIIQFFGILAFLPATMSGALTYEKERASLALLLLTGLRPRQILLQKYLGRLVPIFTFLLLSLPLLAVCYAFGGMTPDDLTAGIYALFLTCLQVGALALLCSAFCRTSLAAFVASYLFTAVLYLGWPFLIVFVLGLERVSERITLAFVPLGLFYEEGSGGFVSLVLRSIPILGTIALFLGLARRFLVTRAFLLPRNLLRSVFLRLDAWFDRINQRFGGIRLVRDRPTLPDNAPVAWRELNKRSLAKPVYLVRLLVLIESAILIVAAAVFLHFVARGTDEAFSEMIFLMWVLAALAVSVLSANAIVSERADQTLDVLLTTPLTGREIVRQKLRGVRRLILVSLVPFGTLFFLRGWWQEAAGISIWHLDAEDALRLGLSMLSVVVFLGLFAWLSLWIGLRVRTRSRAVIESLLTLAVWNAAPFLIGMLLPAPTWYYARAERAVHYMMLLSPTACVASLGGGHAWRVFEGWGYSPLVLALAGHAALLLLLRWVCLRNADRWLGRAVPRPLEPKADLEYPPAEP